MKIKPDTDMLTDYLPIEVWDAAEAQARRSPVRTFKTGAALVDGDFNVTGKGCSHISGGPYPSIHAEHHALLSSYSNSGLTCVIVTLTKNARNWASCSKPCAACVARLHKAGVETVVYAERDNGGEWTVNVESVQSLIDRNGITKIPRGFAKRLQIA